MARRELAESRTPEGGTEAKPTVARRTADQKEKPPKVALVDRGDP